MRAKRLMGIIGEIEEEYVLEAYAVGDVPWEKKKKQGESKELVWEEETSIGGADKKVILGEMPKEKVAVKAEENGESISLHDHIRKQKRTGRNFRTGLVCAAVAVAACLCVVAGRVWRHVPRTQYDLQGDIFLNGVFAGGFLKEPNVEGYHTQMLFFRLLREDSVLDGRVAEYHREDPRGVQSPEIPQLDTTSLCLAKELGEFFMEEDGRKWYKMKGHNDIEMLICKEENGLLRQWRYSHFLKGEAPKPEERVEGKIYIADKYPDADLSAYTYDEIFSVIYGLESAKDIESITARAIKISSNELEQKVEEQIEEQTFVERAQIERLYDILADVPCSGDYTNVLAKKKLYRYSFSAAAQWEGAKAETIYGSRELVIRLTDGTVIEGFKYDACRGYVYLEHGTSSELLEEDVVGVLNEILGIW